MWIGNKSFTHSFPCQGKMKSKLKLEDYEKIVNMQISRRHSGLQEVVRVAIQSTVLYILPLNFPLSFLQKFRCHPVVFNCGCQVGYIRKSLLYHLVVDKFISCIFFVIPQVKCSIPVTRFDKKRKGLTIQIAKCKFYVVTLEYRTSVVRVVIQSITDGIVYVINNILWMSGRKRKKQFTVLLGTIGGKGNRN